MKRIITIIVAVVAALAISSCNKEQSFDYIYGIEVLDAGYSIAFNQIGWPEIAKELQAAGFEGIAGSDKVTKNGPKSKIDSEVIAAVQKGVDAKAGNELLKGCEVKIKNINDQKYIATIVYE